MGLKAFRNNPSKEPELCGNCGCRRYSLCTCQKPTKQATKKKKK